MCQNVCSLNISKPSKKTHSKLISVTRSGADIVFLSDTRLNSDKQIAGINDIEKKLKFLGYSFYHNSKIRSTVYEKIRCRSLKKHNLKIEKKNFFPVF